MINWQTPQDFIIDLDINHIKIVYTDLMEIGQGGPQTGVISINGRTLYGLRFGGPLLQDNGFVFAPMYVKKFLGWGFRLAKINAATLQLELLGKVKSLIFLEKIEDDKIYFFEDINKTVSNNCSI